MVRPRRQLPTKGGTRISMINTLIDAEDKGDAASSSSEEEWHDASEGPPSKGTRSSPRNSESSEPSPPKKPSVSNIQETKIKSIEGGQKKEDKKVNDFQDISPFSTDDESFDEDDFKLLDVNQGPNWKQRLSQRNPGVFTRGPPVKRGTPYSDVEDDSILDYILAKDDFRYLMGRAFWQEAEMHEASGLNRTWQSLKERFVKSIMPNLDKFDKISPTDKKKLRNAMK
jgi:hypothetical protein